MKLIYTFILIIFTTIIYAQPLITDRPDKTESSISIPYKAFQIETGILFEKFTFLDYSEKIISMPSTLFRYGLFKGFELRLQTTMLIHDHISPIKREREIGMDNIQFGFKLNIAKEKGLIPEMALLTHLIIPSGDNAFKNNIYTFQSLMAFSHSISENVGIGYNLGVEYSNEKIYSGIYSLVAGFQLADKLAFFSEIYGSYENFENLLTNADIGLTYLVNQNFQLDTSMGTGLNNKNYFLSLGLTWRGLSSK